MKTTTTIKTLRSKMFKARCAYRQAIVKNLKEIGDAIPVGGDDHEEHGVRVCSVNPDGDSCFTAVVDTIRYEPPQPNQYEDTIKVSVHITALDGETADEWRNIDYLDESASDYVLDSIVWPESAYPDYCFEEGVVRHAELEKAIIGKGNKRSVSDIIYSERPILYSVVYNDGNSVILVDNMKKAKELARRICKETKGEVTINHHSPFEVWREYITVYYGAKRLKWFYLHLDALEAKNY